MRKIIAGAVVLLVAIGCASDPATPDANDLEKLDKQAGNNSAAPEAPAKKYINGGDWEVGKKENLEAGVITAGTYVISVPETGIHCYWETVKDFEGSFDSIIANGNIDPGTTARVVVKSSYAGLSLKGDCIAKKK